ncbi:MAG: hypothetical protein ACE5G3_03175 [Gammaproteobacteria bacterium]
MRRILSVLMFTTALTSGAGAAAEILQASVEKKDGIYHVFGVTLVKAPPEFIFATLMDFDHFHKISGGITETRFVESTVGGEVLGYTRIEACVLFFCRRAEKLERIEANPYREIRTVTIPEKSDFRFSETRWTLSRQNDRTRLTYEGKFIPDFWMPPLITVWAIKRRLISSAENIGMRIEYLAEHDLTLAQVREPVASAE